MRARERCAIAGCALIAMGAWTGLSGGTPERRGFAFQPRSSVEVPAVRSPAWGRNPVDAFILEALERRGLSPSPPAGKRELIRRLSFDLTGLPPDIIAVREFESSDAPGAYERWVDEWLASPRHGERWARHWLDVVHFGETHGYDKDKIRPNAWPYRDYVVRSFNSDKPWSQFVQEQIAGDALFPDDPDGVVALGFLAAGPWDFVGHVELPESKTDGLIARYNDRDDMVMTAMSSFASLTVHCARCHDHKFDPIRQSEYYGLQAVFAGVDRADRPYDPDPELGVRRRQFREQGRDEELKNLPAPQWVYAAAAEFAPQGNFVPARGVRPVHVLLRGDVRSPGEPVEPRAVAAVPGVDADLGPCREGESERRAALARWLTAPGNFLTRRSIVNRVWQYHFGRGLIDTPNDFGAMGGAPSHPELLDWLAGWFQENGESLKALHRLIVTSATYRQASAFRADAAEVDAENRLLWRMNRRRLEAEAVRDAVLAASGDLDLRMGGPSDRQFNFKDDHSPVYEYSQFDPALAEGRRRSLYRFIVRSVPDPFFECMDAADPSLLTAKRGETVTALQALALMNDRFMVLQSERFAARLQFERSSPRGQIGRALELALGREPKDGEWNRLTEFAEEHGLPNLCRVLFNSNEFMFVD